MIISPRPRRNKGMFWGEGANPDPLAGRVEKAFPSARFLAATEVEVAA